MYIHILKVIKYKIQDKISSPFWPSTRQNVPYAVRYVNKSKSVLAFINYNIDSSFLPDSIWKPLD